MDPISDPNNRTSRLRFLKSYRRDVEKQNYPECQVDLIYTTLSATIVRNKSAEAGYEEYSKEIQSSIDKVLGPVDGIVEAGTPKEELSEEEFSILASTQFLSESVGNFTRANSEIIHGSDLANRFIQASSYSEACSQLDRFEDWYREDLQTMFDEMDQDVIHVGPTSFTKTDFFDIAVFNGLRIVLLRREEERPYPSKEAQTL